MTEADIIRSGSSMWLRDNEEIARECLRGVQPQYFKMAFGWSDFQINNMLTYLALVDGDE